LIKLKNLIDIIFQLDIRISTPKEHPWITTLVKRLRGLLLMQRRSSDSVEIKLQRLDYEEVMEKLKIYASKIIERGVCAVILIGSLARGDYTAYSDADVVIIVRESRLNPLDRLVEYLDPTLPVDLEPRVYTVEEIVKMAMEKRRIIKEIVEYGKVLAGDEKIIEDLKNIYYGNQSILSIKC